MSISQDKNFTHIIAPLLVMAVAASVKAYIDVEKLKTERENDISRLIRIEKAINSNRVETRGDLHRLYDKVERLRTIITERK